MRVASQTQEFDGEEALPPGWIVRRIDGDTAVMSLSAQLRVFVAAGCESVSLESTGAYASIGHRVIACEP